MKRTSSRAIKKLDTITLAEYIETSYSYQIYCSNLDDLYTVKSMEWKKILPQPLVHFYEQVKSIISDIASQAKVGVQELILAFKNKDLYALFKALHFNLKTLWKAIHEFTSLIPKGITKVFEDLHKSGVLDAPIKGIKAVDEILNKYPLLKKLAGPAIAGLLLYMWLSMSFLGNPDWDFDMTTIIQALLGHFTIYDLFASPEGLATVTSFLIGTLTGISFPWLASNIANLVIALIYTSVKNMHNNDLTRSLRSLIPLKKL